jgi:hypothetical protein
MVYATLRGVNARRGRASSVLARVLSNTATLLSLLGRTAWADWYAARAIAMAGARALPAAAHVWNINGISPARRSGAKVTPPTKRRWHHPRAGDFNVEPEAHLA